MRLGAKQEEFSLHLSYLIQFAYEKGYRIRMGEVWRSPSKATENAAASIGIANSLHTLKLAVDLNLFKDGKYLRASKDHAELGAYWKSLHHDNCWGGDFSKPDGNHYSRSHGNVK
jgi:hypothetical protein